MFRNPAGGLHVLLSLLALAFSWRSTSAFSFIGSNSRVILQAQQHPTKEDSGELVPERFIIPVFPLRKSVKLPSETLTLNLYEERYLSLAEYVLSKEKLQFGALYCSHKPQLIKGGDGPIVPMVEPGDVGVLCEVLEHQEDMVPSVGGVVFRRRIRLEGLAVSRFRIERVLHNGYDGYSTTADSSKEEAPPLPFILVEASPVEDDVESESTSDRIDRLQEQVYRSMAERDERSSNSNSSSDKHQRQLFSFQAASVLLDNKPASDMLNLLSSTSTADRLQYVIDHL